MGYFKHDIASPDAMLEIAHRRVAGAEPVHLFGFNRSIDTDYETIFNNGGGIYTFPSDADTLTVSSSSASDTMAVLIQGLDANYKPINDVITLEGTSDVETTEEFLRVNNAVILSGTNVGNISIEHGSDLVAYLEVAYGVQQAIIYTVPADHSLYVKQVVFHSGTANFNQYIFSRACTRSSTGRELHFWESTWQTDMKFDLHIPFRVPEKTDFTIESKGSTAFGGANEVNVYLGAILLEEDL